MSFQTSYSTLQDAIRKKNRIEAYYKNYFRVFCPYAIGIGKDGVPVVLAFQVGGGDKSGVISQSRGIWLCMEVADIIGPMPCKGEWIVPEPGKPVETCLDVVEEVAG
ncbi:MAG: hypothetical protein GXP49_10105 [Deltaproteobacteria bacterium]|nr:hypothetical protein [Deltaproteobacteria bacterium]